MDLDLDIERARYRGRGSSGEENRGSGNAVPECIEIDLDGEEEAAPRDEQEIPRKRTSLVTKKSSDGVAYDCDSPGPCCERRRSRGGSLTQKMGAAMDKICASGMAPMEGEGANRKSVGEDVLDDDENLSPQGEKVSGGIRREESSGGGGFAMDDIYAEDDSPTRRVPRPGGWKSEDYFDGVNIEGYRNSEEGRKMNRLVEELGSSRDDDQLDVSDKRQSRPKSHGRRGRKQGTSALEGSWSTRTNERMLSRRMLSRDRRNHRDGHYSYELDPLDIARSQQKASRSSAGSDAWKSEADLANRSPAGSSVENMGGSLDNGNGDDSFSGPVLQRGKKRIRPSRCSPLELGANRKSSEGDVLMKRPNIQNDDVHCSRQAQQGDNPDYQEKTNPFADAVDRIESKVWGDLYAKIEMVQKLTESRWFNVPRHLAVLAVEEPENESLESCADWLWNNHGEELCYGKVLPISSCPHSGQVNADVLNNEELFDDAIMDGGLEYNCPHNEANSSDDSSDDSTDSSEGSRGKHSGQKYLCLECGVVLCSKCEGGPDLRGVHWKDTGHCLFVGLFDLLVWCNECDACFKHPLFEALPKKNASFAGWSDNVTVEYEKAEGGHWQVSSILKPECGAIWSRWNWMRMGEALAESSVLSSIDLSNCMGAKKSPLALLFPTKWKTFPTELLDLSGNPLRSAKGWDLLFENLTSVPALVTLNLDKTELGRSGVTLLANALNRIWIEDLYLDGNRIGNRGVEALLLASNARHLLNLWLSSNGIGSRGYTAICQFLQNRETQLKSLCLTENVMMERGVLNILADSLATNSTLQTIDLEIEGPATSNFERALCNTSCFRTLCESNHTLWSIGDDATDRLTKSSDILLRAFEINARDATIGAKIRSKLRLFYCVGDFDARPFIEINAKLMPKALELATMSEEECGEVDGRLAGETPVLAQNGHLCGIYRIIRNHLSLQELFSFVSPEAKIRELEEENARLKLEVERLSAANASRA